MQPWNREMPTVSLPEHLTIGMSRPHPGLPGGIMATLPSLVEGLAARGVRVKPFLYGRRSMTPALVTRLRDLGASLREISAAAGDPSIDLLHINSSLDTPAILRDILSLRASVRARCPVFLMLHGTDPDVLAAPFMRAGIRSLLASACDAIGVLSREEADAMTGAGIADDRVVVVRNALPDAQFPHDRHWREGLGFGPDVPVLLFISRLIRSKGLFETLDAVRIVRERGESIGLLCVGDGPERMDAERRVAEWRMGDTVRFTGQISEEDARRCYGSLDVLVFPTYHNEGFPMALFQAMAAGMALITTRIRAARDYLREPENCVWVPPKNPLAVADAIQRILRDEVLRGTMKEANLRLKERFSPQVVAGEFEVVYSRLVSGSCR